MKIRQHQGGLDESMKTVTEVEPTLEAIVIEISAKIGRIVRPGEVHIHPLGLDPRTGWDTHTVSVDNWGVYGFVDGPISNHCPCCRVAPGTLHEDWCEVERCCLCGQQANTCFCVYALSGVKEEDRDNEAFDNGPTEEMEQRKREEQEKYGGRIPWDGEWPGIKECREFDLWCYWEPDTSGPFTRNCKTGEISWLHGRWVSCTKDHPQAKPNLNRLNPSEFTWDRKLRKWTKGR